MCDTQVILLQYHVDNHAMLRRVSGEEDKNTDVVNLSRLCVVRPGVQPASQPFLN